MTDNAQMKENKGIHLECIDEEGNIISVFIEPESLFGGSYNVIKIEDIK